MHNVRYTLGLLKKTLPTVQIKDFFDKFFRKNPSNTPYIQFYVTEV